jgi:ferredoxin-thioredoxin reductase catalytic subunit
LVGRKPGKKTMTRADKLIKEYKEYAKKQGFSLNPDERAVEVLVKSLLEREEKFGARFCPCRRITEDREENKKIICPCTYHQREIKEQGRCLCGLFVRKIIK